MKIIVYLATFMACLEPIYSVMPKRFSDFPFDRRNQMRRMLTEEGGDDGFKPGHTLLMPSEDWLRTSVGYPSSKVAGTDIYGAPDKIASAGSDGSSVINTLFRRSDADKHVKTLMNSLLSAVRRISDETGVTMDNEDPTDAAGGTMQFRSSDDSLAAFPDPDDLDKPILRSETTKIPDSYDVTTTSKPQEVPENEKNPGNPFTIFIKKYFQNALWNYKLDGDHMNLHVAAPLGGPPPLEPNGAQLFFGRKWWYFNQDDYLPF